MPRCPILEQLYDNHAQALFAFLLNLTRNEADTRDLLQEVFRKLAIDPAPIESARDERAFLLRLAHNLAIDQFRRRQTLARTTEKLQSPIALFAATANPDETAFRSALTAALDELPLEQRTVVHLKLWEGMTFEAIAEALEIPMNTAASRYRYGVDKLRDRLRPLYEEIK